MVKRLIQGVLLVVLLQPGLPVGASPFEDVPVDAHQGKTTNTPGSERTWPTSVVQKPDATAVSTTDKSTSLPGFDFKAATFPGFYDASRDKSNAYNVPAIVKDIPNMWKSYGSMFKKIGAELGVDPYALAAYCIFESYNSLTHTFNPRMKDFAPKANMYGAGIAATQAQDVKGTKVPGLNVSFPKDNLGTAKLLWEKPEYAIRCLAVEFRDSYKKTGDLAKTFPKVALPGWKPKSSAGAYGTQAQYVSRAFVFYKAFRAADGR